MKAGDVTAGRDAGIGATAAVEPDFFAGDLPDCFLDGALDSRAIGLGLPAGEAAAVELDYQSFVLPGRGLDSAICRQRV